MFSLALAASEGVKRAGGEVVLRRVPETLPNEILEKMHALEFVNSLKTEVPLIEVDEIGKYDAVLFGTPTRFGLMAAQMKNYLDSLGKLWYNNVLVGKIAGVFTSANNQHGGLESTILSFHIVLLHLGFLVAGLPYSYKSQTEDKVIVGGSPYGASMSTGTNPPNSKQPNEFDLESARCQGEHITKLAMQLSAGAATLKYITPITTNNNNSNNTNTNTEIKTIEEKKKEPSKRDLNVKDNLQQSEKKLSSKDIRRESNKKESLKDIKSEHSEKIEKKSSTKEIKRDDITKKNEDQSDINDKNKGVVVVVEEEEVKEEETKKHKHKHEKKIKY